LYKSAGKKYITAIRYAIASVTGKESNDSKKNYNEMDAMAIAGVSIVEESQLGGLLVTV
jgi:hypothetical protein